MRSISFVFVFLMGYSIFGGANLSLEHDFSISKFELKREDGQSVLIARLDREDLLVAIQSICADYNAIGGCFETYMKRHFSIVLDGAGIDYSHHSHVFEDFMIEVKFHVHHNLQNVQKVEVFNDVLIELTGGDQENIFISHLNQNRRSFRMHAGRTRTFFEY